VLDAALSNIALRDQRRMGRTDKSVRDNEPLSALEAASGRTQVWISNWQTAECCMENGTEFSDKLMDL